jgi:hypothetical protein
MSFASAVGLLLAGEVVGSVNWPPVAGVTAPRFVGRDGTTALAMVDTADCYCWWNAPGDPGGHSEALLGRWLAEAGTRDAVYLSTKGSGRLRGLEGVWNDDGSANWDVARSRFVGASAATLEESLAGSLDRLAIDRVDLYYVHVDDHRTPLEESLATLNGFVGDGRVGAYGWSNVRTWPSPRSASCATLTAGRNRSRCSNAIPTCACEPGSISRRRSTPSSSATCGHTRICSSSPTPRSSTASTTRPTSAPLIR